MLADKALGPCDAPFQGRDPQFVVFDPEYHFISYVDAQCFAEGGGNDDAAILIDASSGFFLRHDFHIMTFQ